MPQVSATSSFGQLSMKENQNEKEAAGFELLCFLWLKLMTTQMGSTLSTRQVAFTRQETADRAAFGYAAIES